MIDLSICIVNWNVREKLRECLVSIYRHSKDISIETIVVDNASSDGSLEMVQTCFPEVVLIGNSVNIGFGRANNIAIERCKGNYVILLNPDIVVTQSLKRMITYLRKLPKAGVVGCKLVNLEGFPQKSYFYKFPTLWSEFLWGTLLYRITYMSNNCKSNDGNVFEVDWIVGACMMFERNFLLKLGGFDNRFFLYGEDVDLCYRIKKIKYQVYYLNNIKMIHYHGVSSSKQEKSYYSAVLQKESRYLFIKKHFGVFSSVVYRIIWAFCAIFRILLLITACSICYTTRCRTRYYFSSLSRHYRILLWTVTGIQTKEYS